MSARWRLAARGLGPVEHVDAEIRPLTLLIGENNSGKSYFATLLWGLVAVGWTLASPEGHALDACEAWARARLPPAAPGFDRALTEAEVEMFQRLFDAALDAGKDALLERLFRSKKVKARFIGFRSVAPASELSFTHGYDPYVLHLRFFDKPLGHALGSIADRTLEIALSLDPWARRYEPSRWASSYPALAAWSPESMLNLFAFAAADALEKPLSVKGRELLAPQDLVAALAETSRMRVEELKKEYPVVLRLRNLAIQGQPRGTVY